MKQNLKEQKKDFTIIFIYVCVLLSVIFCTLLRYTLIIENNLKSFIMTLLYFIPSLIFIMLLLLYKNNRIKKRNLLIIQFSVIICSIIYIFILSFISLIVELTDGGINNVTNYGRVYNYNNFEYFPKKIPNNAKNVIFHYNPSIFQGGEIFSLYFKTDDNTLKKYTEKYQENIITEENNKIKDIKKMEDSILYYTPYKNSINDINDFNIYSLYSKCDSSGYCNHGMMKLILIKNDTNEILFYYENW